tara:strand:- start:1261 stop:1824 length:564 start_codon:yes stop_codon:yes gene_type:complete
MQSPDRFIVRPIKGRRYNNTKDIGGLEFITSTSEEDFKFSNREAEVLSLPLNYQGEIEVGDVLLVHHNVFKFYNDMRGRRKSGRSFFKDDIFFIEDEQFYMYKKNGKWKAHGKNCFIKPSAVKKSFIDKPGQYEPLIGTVKYINEELIKLGVKEGDEISFQPESEYEFRVDDEVLFRMFTNNITFIV